MDIAAGVVGLKATNIVLMFMLRHFQVITLAIDDIAFQQVLKLSLLGISPSSSVRVRYGNCSSSPEHAPSLWLQLPNASSPGSTTPGPLGLRPSLPLTNIRPAPRSRLTSIFQTLAINLFSPTTHLVLLKLPSEDCHRFCLLLDTTRQNSARTKDRTRVHPTRKRLKEES
jgi:hypothetical protein